MHEFFGGKIVLHEGDCREKLAELPDNSIDSCVTDPPYALVSIGKRFGKDGAAAAKSNGPTGVYQRASRGFMGCRWDTGEAAFSPELWAEVLRVLKPGAHLISFSGTRTYHRMACAIEDAGFEIRDQLAWCYGSGFPKSHDISKAIDKMEGAERPLKRTPMGPTGNKYAKGLGDDRPWMQKAAILGYHESASDEPITETSKEWDGWGTALKPSWEPIVLARKPLSEKTISANVLRWGVGALHINACRIISSIGQRLIGYGNIWEDDQFLCNSCVEHVAIGMKQPIAATKGYIATKNAERITSVRGEIAPADIRQSMDIGCSDGIRASEIAPISINSNIEESGSPIMDQSHKDMMSITSTETKETIGSKICSSCGREIIGDCTKQNIRAMKKGSPNMQDAPGSGAHLGRWPSNLCHDGSEEVLACFPDSESSRSILTITPGGIYGGGNGLPSHTGEYGFNDSGSAARFFYTAKADSDDRLGSKHPTVKPVDLMQWLVRLITPKGGVCLDMFAGTGTTAEACFREGMRCILIEREAEYVADIERRMSLIMAGPVERSHESIKARGREADAGPLFGGGETPRHPRPSGVIRSGDFGPFGYDGDE